MPAPSVPRLGGPVLARRHPAKAGGSPSDRGADSGFQRRLAFLTATLRLHGRALGESVWSPSRLFRWRRKSDVLSLGTPGSVARLAVNPPTFISVVAVSFPLIPPTASASFTPRRLVRSIAICESSTEEQKHDERSHFARTSS